MVATDASGGHIVNRPDRLLLLVLLICFAGPTRSSADEGEGGLTWDTESDVRIDIENISGRIEIKGWDRDEVRLELDEDRARSLDIDGKRQRIKIRSSGLRRGRLGWGAPGEGVDIDLYVPTQSRIKAMAVNGDIRSEGVDGTLDFHAANGQIEVRGSPREVRLETLNSSIKVEGDARQVDARTLNGSIELRGVGGEVTVSTMSGSIKVEGDALDRVDLKTLSGSIELVGRLAERARARLKTFSGSIKVEIPSETSARFDVESFSGSIQNEFKTTTTREQDWRGGQRLEFTADDGDGRVSIESFSGAVEIKARD
jgi:hypothetical protein